MSNVEILISIVIVIVGTAGIISYIFPRLKKKGIDVSNVLNKLERGLEEVKTGLAVVNEIAPNIPQIEVLTLIEKWAEIGVEKAQQLYISSQLSGEERNQAARDTIIATLDQLDIPITENLQKIINDTIESNVFNLKSEYEKKVATEAIVTEKVESLQSTVSQLQDSNIQLIQQNAELTQKLTTIQSAIAPVVEIQ